MSNANAPAMPQSVSRSSDGAVIWSPWIEWKGGECPLPKGVICDIRLRDGSYHRKLPAGENCVDRTPDAGPAFWRHDGEGGDIIAYRYHLPEQSPGISDLGEEAALQEAFERMSGESIAAESKREATEKWEQDQHNYRKLQQLCIEQAHELNKLRSQVRRMNEISRE